MKKLITIGLMLLSMAFGLSAFAGQGWNVAFYNNTNNPLYVREIHHENWYINDFKNQITVPPSTGYETQNYYTEHDGSDTGLDDPYGFIMLGVYTNPQDEDSQLYGLIVIDDELNTTLEGMLWADFDPSPAVSALESALHNQHLYDGSNNIYATNPITFWNQLSGNPLQVTCQFN